MTFIDMFMRKDRNVYRMSENLIHTSHNLCFMKMECLAEVQ